MCTFPLQLVWPCQRCSGVCERYGRYTRHDVCRSSHSSAWQLVHQGPDEARCVLCEAAGTQSRHSVSAFSAAAPEDASCYITHNARCCCQDKRSRVQHTRTTRALLRVCWPLCGQPQNQAADRPSGLLDHCAELLALWRRRQRHRGDGDAHEAASKRPGGMRHEAARPEVGMRCARSDQHPDHFGVRPAWLQCSNSR